MSISIAAYESMIEKLVDCQSALAAERARADALRTERDAECDRAMKAEVKVRYYESALCVGDIWTMLRDEHERGGRKARAIDPERVSDVLADRDRLRAAIEQAPCVCNWAREGRACHESERNKGCWKRAALGEAK